jgi:hypothetical protein
VQKLYSGSRLKQRRTTSDPIQFMPRPRRQGSLKEFRNDMHHAATETYMITRLAITLLKLLGYVVLTVRTARFILVCSYLFHCVAFSPNCCAGICMEFGDLYLREEMSPCFKENMFGPGPHYCILSYYMFGSCCKQTFARARNHYNVCLLSSKI